VSLLTHVCAHEDSRRYPFGGSGRELVSVYLVRRLSFYSVRLTLMVQGRKTAKQALTLIRRHARRYDWTVEPLPKRGKGSHTIHVVRDGDGKEIGRVALTGHAGDMSWTVTRSVEQALEPIFGEGWMD
jgi:hypothetical protein